MSKQSNGTAIETIDLLNARLKRIEYVVYGNVDSEKRDGTDASVYERLSNVEHVLHQLSSKPKGIQELLRFYSRYPDLFQSVEPTNELPTTLDTPEITAIVLASASLYPTTASRLTSIVDTPIPEAELSTQLISLQPRIAKLEAIQAAQNSDLAELRQRTAALIQRWYAVDVLGAGDNWAELEERVEKVEQGVRRAELAKRIDEGMV
ncbi:hypothetical protein F5884DRAFT_237753 [Xylogone sp. PMI_703]|nr:hypothetical protein F5884DRAFT_237753 [Xylogone sp. PMI_703]